MCWSLLLEYRKSSLHRTELPATSAMIPISHETRRVLRLSGITSMSWQLIAECLRGSRRSASSRLTYCELTDADEADSDDRNDYMIMMDIHLFT